MTPAHLRNEHVITDFVQTFERDTGLDFTSCHNIVEDSNSIFYTFSYLIKHLLSLINSIISGETLTIKYLTVSQRKVCYIELSKIGIRFTKTRYFDVNRNYCTDICTSIIDIWSIPYYRHTPQLAIYQYHINIFEQFYSSITILGNHANGNIIVSLSNFLQFKRIFNNAITSYNQQRYINNTNYNIVSMSQQLTTGPRPSICKPSLNTIIKHQLADFIFDIKDDLTDAIYKEILEKIALISP